MLTQEIIDQKWNGVLEDLHACIPEITYNAWIKPLEVARVVEKQFVLRIADQVGVKALTTRYFSALQKAINDNFGGEFEIIILSQGQPMPDAPSDPFKRLSAALNPRYTFDTFVVGDSNRFAHGAALAVAEMPSVAYNPLFLYGGVGLGKTHLMHAIGHYILKENPEANVLYITSETFTNELIAAISKKTNQEFRDRLRSVDVLMVDDIQFIAGKPSTQEEFFHTFNHLHGSGKQIIISSDRPPKEIPTLEERLSSRFEWGLIADLQKPNYETRCAILMEKARQDHIEVPEDVIHYIAANVESNIRELEGYLTRVSAAAGLQQKEITRELAESALTGVIGKQQKKKLTVEGIMDVVGHEFNVEKSLLTSTKRTREIALPRQICMYLARDMTSLSTTVIGETFGRDHTTVMHATEKIEAMAKDDPSFAQKLDELRKTLQG